MAPTRPQRGQSAGASGTASSSKGPPAPPSAASTSGRPTFSNPKAETLYDMLEFQASSSSQTYTQSDLLALPVASSVQELMPLCQELINLGLFQLLALDGNVCYRLKSHSDASKVQALDSDARIIYSAIEAAGTAGIWTKTLKGRTNLHQTVLTRALKMLESKNYVKQVRNAKYPGRKIYMLKNLKPTDEVTGGPWYTDGELDQDLVHVVSDVILTYVETKSWRQGPKIKKPSAGSSSRHTHHMISVHDRILLPHPPGYTGYPIASEILTFIDSNNLVSGKDIELADLQTLLDILVFDRKLEIVSPASSRYNSRKRKHREQHTSTTHSRSQQATHDDEDDEEDPISSRPTKRRKVYGLHGTPSPAASSSSVSDDDDNDDDPPVPEEPMYRTVRHTGYPAPIASDKHDHAAPAPAPAPPPAAPPDDPTATSAAAVAAAADDAEPSSSKPKQKPRTLNASAGLRTAFAETPCARCPVFRLCEQGGPVDARSCGYFGGWLAADEVDFTTGAGVKRAAAGGAVAGVGVVEIEAAGAGATA